MKNIITIIKQTKWNKDCCCRCGITKGSNSGGCTAWGKFWKRHIYTK